MSAAMLCAQVASAAQFDVVNNNDSGAGSLRAAINAANANPGADVIQFTFTVPAPPVFLNLLTQLPAITGDVTINGPGLGLIIQPDPITNAEFTVFTITGTPTVVFNSLTISQGKGPNGGAISAVGGTITVSGCLLNDNEAAASGGAIYVAGPGNATLNITNTAIFNNVSMESGAGIAFIRTGAGGIATLNLNGASLERNQIRSKTAGKTGAGVYVAGPGGPHAVNIMRSTFADNAIQTAGIGGGLYVEGSGAGTAIILTNSTFSGNGAAAGPAISYQNTSLSVTSCTIFANNATGGVNASAIRDASNAGFSCKNTIISGNIAATMLRDLAPSQPLTGNHNLIGVGGTLTNGINGNIVGITNPRLVPLGNNGGTTRTFALQPDSPALDAGSNADAGAIDQRGQPRPSDGNNDGTPTADIGAFETQRYLVTNTNNSGANSLRQALIDNNTAGGGFVKFAIAPLNSAKTIPVTGSAFPNISRTIFIDGWSQGGNAYLGPPLIEIDGSAVAASTGLSISAGDCVIRGLAVNAFPGVGGGGVGIGFFDQASLRNWVYGCYIGVGLDGTTPRGNGQIGVWLAPAANSNTIGTNSDGVNDAAERNIISGSTANGIATGVYIQSNANIIAGNYIGTDRTGLTAIPNNNGIWIAQGTSNRIGTDGNAANVSGGRNVISGNSNVGVALTSQGSNNLIAGNYIGLKSDGLSALPNSMGVMLDNVTLSLVGGQTAGARNVISGNTAQGVLISGANAVGNVLWGNYIGLNAAGTVAVGNGTNGVHVRAGATFTRIGGDGSSSSVDAARRNVISGNLGRGILIAGTAAQPTGSTRVFGNYIGLAADGLAAIGNTLAGVSVNSSKENLIGAIEGGRNYICGQTDLANGHGVEITGIDAVSNVISNNSIGVNTAGGARHNAGAGVSISGGATFNLTGGKNAGEGNLIASNTLAGVQVTGNDTIANAILGNAIFDNVGLGIDLAANGVTPNGPAGPARIGPNELQNYPVIQSVTSAGVATASLAAKSSSTFRVEFFASPLADPSAFGEGLTYLGFVTVATDITGNSGPFSFSFSPPVGQPWITATATEIVPGSAIIRGVPTPPGTALNTSEFSAAVRINTGPTAQPVIANGFEDTDLAITLAATDPDGGTLDFTIESLPSTGALFQFGTSTQITAPGTPVNDASGRVTFRPAANGFGSPYTTFTFSASDGLATSNTATATVNIAPVADTPSVTDATTFQSQQTTSGLVISRNPADGAEVTHFKITGVSNGQLFLNDGATPVANGSFITFAQGNAGLRFTPANLFVGQTTFNVQASLSGSDAGIGGAVAVATITVLPRAFTPNVTNATTPEDTQSTSGLVITRSSQNGPEVTHFKITGITNGALFLNDGVTPVANGAFITAAQGAAGLKFTPNPDFFGLGDFDVQSSISASDTGLGGNAIPAVITVTPVADTPSVTNSTTPRNVQTTTGLVISRNPVDGAEVTHFKITAIANGTLFLNDGVTPVANGAFITFAQGNAGLKFTPALNFVGNGTFNVQASLANNDSGIGGGTATATITVTPTALTPSVTNSSTLEDTQTTVGLVILPDPTDSGATTHFKITGIINGALFQNNGTTPIANGAFITIAQGALGLKFTPAPDFFGAGSFTVQASMSAADAGLGGSTLIANITIDPVPDTPSVTNASTLQNVQTTSGLVISRAPVDGAEVTHFKITGISNGQLFLNDGVTPVAEGAFITFAQANAGLKFTPAPLFTGNTTFNVHASLNATDAGIGGGAAIATITVGAQAFTPSVTDSSTLEDIQTTTGLVITRNAQNGPEVTHFKITSITNGALFQNNGTTPIVNGAFITVAQGNAGLKFTPSADYFGVANFSVQASISASDAGIGGGGGGALATINIAPVADTPSVTNAAAFEGQQTTSGLVISRNPVDGPEVTHFKITAITGGTLFLNDGVTQITAPAFITFAQGNAGLKFTPTPGVFQGTGSFNVQASLAAADSGIGGATVTATITINPINQPPNFTAANPPAVLERTGLVTIPSWVASFDPGRSNETSQTVLAYIVDDVSNPTLFSVLPAVSAAGTLTYTTAANGYGASTFRVRVRDTGGTANGGSDTSPPQTFQIVVRPAVRCQEVTIDARTVCVSLTVTPNQLNLTPPDAGPGATQSIVFSRDLSQPFPIGVTPVTITANYSDGLTSSETCRVTVLGIDCNNDGIPDSCQGGTSASSVDCNGNGIPDECECFWDNGLIPIDQAATANGQLSHEGGGVLAGARAADDFYLVPGNVYRISSFVGQMLTNSFYLVRKARLEIYEDCDGAPSGTPIYVNTKSKITSTMPAGGGFDMVTYSFNICEDELWLDGGKSYWVSLVGRTDAQGSDLSYWVTSSPHADPARLMGKSPQKAYAPPGMVWGQVNYGPWESGADCCGGCVNLAWKLSGEACKVVWDNGVAEFDDAQGAGGSPSGAYGAGLPEPKTVDDFVLAPCTTVEVCYLEGIIWTNCSPVLGFAEIYPNNCPDPGFAPIFTATATKVVPIKDTINSGGQILRAYKLIFTAPPGWTLPGGKTYWISFGAHGSGALNQRSLFAYVDTGCRPCPIQINAGKLWQPFNNVQEWTTTNKDHSFRIAVRKSTPSPIAAPGCQVDIDGDGSVTITDMFQYLNHWFSGCP